MPAVLETIAHDARHDDRHEAPDDTLHQRGRRDGPQARVAVEERLDEDEAVAGAEGGGPGGGEAGVRAGEGRDGVQAGVGGGGGPAGGADDGGVA